MFIKTWLRFPFKQVKCEGRINIPIHSWSLTWNVKNVGFQKESSIPGCHIQLPCRTLGGYQSIQYLKYPTIRSNFYSILLSFAKWAHPAKSSLCKQDKEINTILLWNVSQACKGYLWQFETPGTSQSFMLKAKMRFSKQYCIYWRPTFKSRIFRYLLRTSIVAPLISLHMKPCMDRWQLGFPGHEDCTQDLLQGEVWWSTSHGCQWTWTSKKDIFRHVGGVCDVHLCNLLKQKM